MGPNINIPAASDMDWGLIGSTVVTGLVVVFLILAILVLFLVLFGAIFKAINNAGSKKAQLKQAAHNPAAPHVPEAPAPAAPDDDDYIDEDDEEIIAVIAAAIAAYGAAEGKQYRIAGIKRPRGARSGWSSAGIADNMRGFMN
ncbi:MAG: OadG family protein [Ruminiclostridium sp.]|nr:OadG family protein [Ruminiclostridium sp.]